MPVINQQLPGEGPFLTEAVNEVSAAFEEAVTILRYTGESGGDAASGEGATPAFITLYSKANITALSPEELAKPAGFYVPGDLHAEFRIQVFGIESYNAEAQSAGRRADQVVYLGRTYNIKGHVAPINQDGVQWWQAVLTQVG